MPDSSLWQIITCILQTTAGMGATSVACKHLLWRLLSVGITDGMTVEKG